MKTRAVIALGSNLGDREKTIQKALKQIAKLRGVELVVASKNYVSQALTETGFDPDQPEFINAVAIIETKLAAKKLLSRLNEIESKFGRIRLARWAPRAPQAVRRREARGSIGMCSGYRRQRLQPGLRMRG